MHSEKYAVLISIFPVYANQIFEGTKKIEFRKKAFQADVKKVVVYSTLPTGKVEGFWDFDGIESVSSRRLWRKYSKVGGIEKKKYDEYFSGCEIAYGIKVKNPQKFANPFDISEINRKAPQSYVYLTEEEFKEICKKGGV